MQRLIVAFVVGAATACGGVAVAAQKSDKAEKSVAKPAADKATDSKTTKPEAKAPAEHVAYAAALWKFITRDAAPYTKWTQAKAAIDLPQAPPATPGSKTYLNKEAAADPAKLPHGSLLVTEHFTSDGKTLTAVTVAYRPKAGYDSRNDDWYWAVFAPGGKHVECSILPNGFSRRGFVAFEKEGRLWVYRVGSPDLADFAKKGPSDKHVTRIGAGPGGMTVKAPDYETVDDYSLGRPGFIAKLVKGHLWVFRIGSKEAAEFAKFGEPAKSVTRVSAGPNGLTIRGPDAATIDEYMTAKAGFVTAVVDGRLWVFRKGSQDLADFQKKGPSDKHITRIGAGPGGMTIKAPDVETVMEYLTARDGFTTVYKDERLWVFRLGTEPLWEYRKFGELAKHVIRPAGGPLGLTIKGPDAETVDLYMKLASQ